MGYLLPRRLAKMPAPCNVVAPVGDNAAIEVSMRATAPSALSTAFSPVETPDAPMGWEGNFGSSFGPPV